MRILAKNAGKIKLPELTYLTGRQAHKVSVRFFGGVKSPEAEKEAFHHSVISRRDDIRRAYARGFLRRGIKRYDKKITQEQGYYLAPHIQNKRSRV
jgi:hypothetical protein